MTSESMACLLPVALYCRVQSCFCAFLSVPYLKFFSKFCLDVVFPWNCFREKHSLTVFSLIAITVRGAFHANSSLCVRGSDLVGGS